MLTFGSCARFVLAVSVNSDPGIHERLSCKPVEIKISGFGFCRLLRNFQAFLPSNTISAFLPASVWKNRTTELQAFLNAPYESYTAFFFTLAYQNTSLCPCAPDDICHICAVIVWPNCGFKGLSRLGVFHKDDVLQNG